MLALIYPLALVPLAAVLLFAALLIETLCPIDGLKG